MHFAPWYRREDYALLREIMDDGEDSLPLAFDEWERNAECERAAAKTRGNNHNSGFHRPRRVFLVLYAEENPAQQNDARNLPTAEGRQVTPWGCEAHDGALARGGGCIEKDGA